MIDNLTIKDIKELKNLFSNHQEKTIIDDEIRIVILQRGWIYVGNYQQIGHQCELTNAYCIRRWGTERGLGELALEGKKENTILDKAGTIKFHELTGVASLLCNKKKWEFINE